MLTWSYISLITVVVSSPIYMYMYMYLHVLTCSAVLQLCKVLCVGESEGSCHGGTALQSQADGCEP